ncbi:MAG: HAD-IC family P-type ATPase [Salegentibacter sp.]|uniref:cation-translocating P-type ATPase n=1 Tax=Salegentibacter sp. TaxID=1903072 RepID=UPI0028700DB9|nr:HAD-IC family P-type ATPase [Salegentibacter sp.]MDR9456942.1 HAD-IC family P-type ATPase [Salegentibacter sp.]
MEIDQKHPYHSISIEETLEKVSGKKEGLSSEEAQKRQEKFGKNKLPEKGGMNPFLLFLKQFKDFLILILFIAAGVAWWADQMADVYIILAVILFNAIMGFTQEYKAEKAIESIKSLVKKKAYVLRNGKEEEMPAEEVVPGDVIILKEGSTVPADGRLLERKDLRATEASLTGESMPVEKKTEPVDKDAAIGDRANMVWKGTNIARGEGKAVVTAIGKQTEIGEIARSMGEMKIQDSNFKKKTSKLGKQMAIIAITTALIVFAIGYWYRHLIFQDILLVTIATLVSSIPEGLPVVISIVLAIGANRMAKKKAIIREFTATEMMGSVSTILSDKTGTITQSILTVKKIFTGSGQELSVSGSGYQLEGDFKKEDENINLDKNPVESKLMAIAAFCNNASIKSKEEKEKKEENRKEDEDKDQDEGPKVTGDPTEAAMLVMSRKAKIKQKEPYKNYKLLDDLPFNSEQKFRASLIETEEGPEIFAIGAPERILELSSHWLSPDGPQEMTDEKREEIGDKIDQWTGEAMRVLSQGYKNANGKDSLKADDVKDLVWVGITGIIDPPRKGVKESIQECKTAGVRVMMVTGDHKKTAAAIAVQVGIVESKEQEEGDKYPVSLTSKELDVKDEKFDDFLEHVNVYARVGPQTKLRIAERLQAKDTMVAMTGDGVNDAPALKRADVGIAMGQRGTDVAKDASQIVLQDDNFSSIVNAIREGRIVFENVKKTSYFLLTTNFASTSVLIVGLSLGFPIPLTAAMILYVNLITDGVMDIALATEPGHGEIMHQPPVKKSASILNWDIAPYLLLMAAIMVTLSLFVLDYYMSQGTAMARTGTFLMVAMTQLYNVFNMRSLRQSIFEIGIFSNKWINIAFVASLGGQIAVIKIPFLRDLFGFEELPILHFLVIFALSSLVLFGGELYKYLKFKKNLF